MMKQAILKAAMTLVLFIYSTGYGQQIGIRGRVVDQDYRPIQDATVRLVKADSSTTTDWNGDFFLDMTSTSVLMTDRAEDVFLFRNGSLLFNGTTITQKVWIEVFDFKGQRVNNISLKQPVHGMNHISILPDHLPAMMFFVKIRIGNRTTVFNILKTGNRINMLPGKKLYSQAETLRKRANGGEVIDTLEVSKEGYETTRTAIRSYTTDLPDIRMEPDGSNDQGLPPVVNGKSAKTTRYWDCCKPHCGWHSNMRMCDISGNDLYDQGAGSGCDGGPSFQCMDYAPIEINSKVSYGWAAFNNSGTNCGDCFQLDFQGALEGKQMIVQVINIGDGGNDAFDLLIPGGGVGALNGCSRQWNNAPLGEQYGGFHSTCGNDEGCIRGMCQAAFGDKEDLMRGCEWYLTWFKMTSNPQVSYMKVSCPQEIRDISHIGN